MSADSRKSVTLTPRIVAVLVIAVGLVIASQFSASPSKPAIAQGSANSKAASSESEVLKSEATYSSEKSNKYAAGLAAQLPKPLTQRPIDSESLPDWFVPKSQLDELMAGSDSSPAPIENQRQKLESFQTWTDSPAVRENEGLGDYSALASKFGRPPSSPFSMGEQALDAQLANRIQVEATNNSSLAWPDSAENALALLQKERLAEEEGQQNLPGGLVSSVQAKKIGATLTREPRKKYFVYQPGMKRPVEDRQD